MPKRSFILNDESIFNDYGFRVLTTGIDTSRFEKNPVMLYSHTRPWEGNGEPATPIGKWEGLRKQGSVMMGDPIFDDEGPDDFAKKISHKVDKGFLNTASVYLDIIELSEDPAFMLPGQTMPTITKSVLKEASIVDIPGNENCISMMLSYEGQTIKLTGGKDDQHKLQKLFSTNNKNDTSMKSLIVKLNSHSGIKLSDSASEAEVLVAMDKVISENTLKLQAKEQENATLTAQVTELNDKIAAQELQGKKDKAIALVEGAKQAKKITESEVDSYLKLAEADFESTKKILDARKGFDGVSAKLSSVEDEGGDDDSALAEEYDKAFKSGKLEKIKLSSPDKYKAMFKAKFGKEPK